MSAVRPPAVAGAFYPVDPEALRGLVTSLLASARPSTSTAPKALIAPHAGYLYSGPIAASAYASLRLPRPEPIRRVVLLGTAHRAGALGLATSGADAFATPLGVVPVARDALERVADLPQVAVDDRSHRDDHALEVQLPFLQATLGEFAIVPFLVGRVDPGEVAEVLGRLWGGDETLIVVSSDLSHYLDYDTATRRDRATAEAVAALRPEGLGLESACGARAVAGLLLAARREGLRAEAVDVRNSGDTAGPRDRVVGYGAFLLGTPLSPPEEHPARTRDTS